MDPIRAHFEAEAAAFDRIIVTLIPRYRQMVDALIAALPFKETAPIRVVDLGCGTGTVALGVLEKFSNADVTCLDVAENMIAIAQTKLARYPRVHWLTGAFDGFEARAPYDAVVSSLALHHLPTADDKREFYRRIFSALNSGGAFYNADVVLGSNETLQALYMDRWRAFMRRGVSDAEIDGEWLPKYHAEDRPAALMDQLDWLREIGFAGVDVVWKHYNFAVYGGVKAHNHVYGHA